uniref:Uncharacterized protein n=1 Tax=Xiphophorus maculatus TaxID=8083 RepID=A0A3B5RD65_XIPMA
QVLPNASFCPIFSAALILISKIPVWTPRTAGYVILKVFVTSSSFLFGSGWISDQSSYEYLSFKVFAILAQTRRRSLMFRKLAAILRKSSMTPPLPCITVGSIFYLILFSMYAFCSLKHFVIFILKAAV